MYTGCDNNLNIATIPNFTEEIILPEYEELLDINQMSLQRHDEQDL